VRQPDRRASIIEGTANFLVDRRMNKAQQMRVGTRQVRCAVYNGTLGSGLAHRFEPLANAGVLRAAAA